MIIRCNPATGEVTIHDPDVFTSFQVEAPAATTTAEVSKMLGTPEADQEAHVWVRIDQIRQLAGQSTPAWNEGFQAMINYASTKGWTNQAATMLLAHIEPI